MKCLRCFLLALVVAVFGMYSAVWAAPVAVGQDWNQGYQEQVGFYVVKGDLDGGDGSLDFYCSEIDLDGRDLSLQYKVGNGDWTDYSQPLSISTPNSYELISLRLTQDGDVIDADGDLTFTSYERTFQREGASDLDLYDSLIVNWGTGHLSFMVAQNSVESFAPTPLPATMLLLGVGIAGLVGFQRRRVQ